MKDLDRRHPAALCLIVAGLLCLLAPQALRAQQPTPSPPPRRPPPTNRPTVQPLPNRNEESLNQRALDLALLSTLARRETDAELYKKRLAAQLVQDFERLWQINTETIVPLSSAETMNYKNLSQATAEIKARATRIKYLVTLPLHKKKGEQIRYEVDATKLGAMLPELHRAITSFLENPVFRVNSPNDAELRSAAGRDLETVIKLSQAINKVSKSLSKSAQPSR